MSKNTDKPKWGLEDIALVQAYPNTSPRYVANVRANRQPGKYTELGFIYSRYNEIGKVTMFKHDKGYIVRLKCANVKRFETFVTNEPGIDTIREILAGWVSGSDALASIALASPQL